MDFVIPTTWPLILVPIFLGVIIIWSIVDVLKSKLDKSTKGLWIVAILVGGIIGVMAYWMAGKPRSRVRTTSYLDTNEH